jgi:hypothetical protein
MNTARFMHSNLKVPVEIFPEKAFAVFYMPANQTTVVLSDAGAILPVEGTQEEVTEALKKVKEENSKSSTKATKGKK